MSARLVNVCPVTTILKVPGPDGFTVKTSGPAGGTMGGCSTCAATRATHPTRPSTMRSFISPGLRQQFRIRCPDLQRLLAPVVHRHAQLPLQSQADTRNRAVVARDVITGLHAAAGAA